MTIDWSKAPEGYDFHLLGKSNVAVGKFYRAQSDRFRSEAGGYVLYADLPENLFFITSRPPESAAWVGLGLPPAGTICEFSLNRGRIAWEVGAVIGNDGPHQVVIKHGHNAYHARNIHGVRPIRTAEQIEAETRKAAIEQICIDAGSPEMTPDQLNVAAKLYDAGYRKQEHKPASKDGVSWFGCECGAKSGCSCEPAKIPKHHSIGRPPCGS